MTPKHPDQHCPHTSALTGISKQTQTTTQPIKLVVNTVFYHVRTISFMDILRSERENHFIGLSKPTAALHLS